MKNIVVDASELEAFSFCKKQWYASGILGLRLSHDLMDLGVTLHNLHNSPISKTELFVSNGDLGIKGRIDYIISEGNIPHLPVEIKKSLGKFGVYHSHKIQLTAYSLLLMRAYAHPVPYGYLLYKEQRTKIKIPISSGLISETMNMVNTIKVLKEKFDKSENDHPIVVEFLSEIKSIELKNECKSCSLEEFCHG
jgi:CRISPR-associated protein Cas4